MSEVPADTAQYSFKVSGTTFQVLALHGHEEVSGLFSFRLSLWLDDPEVAMVPLLRKDAEIKATWAGKEKSTFGLVASFSQVGAGVAGLGGVDRPYGEYIAEVVPTLWLLGHQTNCRVFQRISADKIIVKILNERGLAGKFESRLKSSYPIREYCVQYRETDLAFISRLMEEEGIFYFFTHEGKEMMVLADHSSSYATCSPDDTVEFKTSAGSLASEKEVFSNLVYEDRAYTGKVRLKDYDYTNPTDPLKAEGTAPKNTDLEIYDYHPERYADTGRGRTLARIAVEAQASMRTILSGSGTWRSLGAGCTFTLEKGYRGDMNRDWVVVQVSLSVSQSADTGVSYSVSFLAIPADVTYRPLPRTPHPTLGPQTAAVVGPPGEEIYMDTFGRAKVQFHWDLEGKNDDRSSCWIRVAQPWAGIQEETRKKHGFQWHPLVGDEVVVDFLEGDPDNPIIVGSVYNGVNLPPIRPDELIRNIILTRYQHRLLMDDKNKAIHLNTPYPHTLRMDDPERRISLTTRYDHALRLQDPSDDEIPTVTLETGGAEIIKMEDRPASSHYGNNIRITTADDHHIHMAEGAKAQGIKVVSRKGNTIVLDDMNKNVLIHTTAGHRLLLDDDNERILVTSRKKHKIHIDDKAETIEIADASGSHRFSIDIAGKKLTISTSDGSIDIKAPKGKVSVDCDSFELKAKADAEITCTNLTTKASSTIKTEGANITTKAQMKHETEAMNVKIKAMMEITLEAMNINSKAQLSNKIQGTFVNSEAMGIATLKGVLVKINC